MQLKDLFNPSQNKLTGQFNLSVRKKQLERYNINPKQLLELKLPIKMLAIKR